jgi:electron-transferring-flavoprotein dehydrogenase
VNVLKIKGAHNAIKSGILAAESIIEHEKNKNCEKEITEYEKNLRKSWINEELYRSRNTKGAFKWGLYGGLAYNGLLEYITKGKEPWDIRNTKKDSEHL